MILYLSNGNGVHYGYGSTSTVIYVFGSTASTPDTIPWLSGNAGYAHSVEETPSPTKADLARAAMREFLGSVRPTSHRLPVPDLAPPPRRMFQMVHRRRCQSLGPRRPPRFSRA